MHDGFETLRVQSLICRAVSGLVPELVRSLSLTGFGTGFCSLPSVHIVILQIKAESLHAPSFS